MTIQQKVSMLLDLRSQINEKKKQLEPLQAQRDELQQNIIEHLRKSGFASVKTEQATISRVVSKRLVVVDEKAVVADLKKRGLNDYVVETVNRQIFSTFANQMASKGKKLKGTEIAESEYISVRQSKPKKDGKEEK